MTSGTLYCGFIGCAKEKKSILDLPDLPLQEAHAFSLHWMPTVDFNDMTVYTNRNFPHQDATVYGSKKKYELCAKSSWHQCIQFCLMLIYIYYIILYNHFAGWRCIRLIKLRRHTPTKRDTSITRVPVTKFAHSFALCFEATHIHTIYTTAILGD